MTRRRKKTKITVYLDPDVTTALIEFAARQHQSQSVIAEATIAVESLAVFPLVASHDTGPARAGCPGCARRGGQRYERLVAALGRRLAHGPKLQQEIAEDVSARAQADSA